MKKLTMIACSIVTFVALSTVAAFAQPSVAAPTPPALSAAKVVSIFSDAYTNVVGTDFNPNWGQSTAVSTVQIAGDNTLKYANLNYQGTALAGSVNAFTMKKLHIDVWTANGTTFQITPISPGPKEKLIALTPLTQNAWNSFDIDLSQFTGVNMADLFQFKIVGDGTVYIDNLYLYDSSSTVDAEAPTGFTATKGVVTSESVELLLNATDNSGAVNYEITYGNTTLKVGGVSGVQKSYAVTGLLGNTDYSFSIVAKDPTGNAAANNPIVVTAKTLTPIPAAPTPTRAASSVISIFSDAYTNVANTNFFPGWGQSTVATIAQLAPNNGALKYANLNYQGIELGSHVNASAMKMLHVDVYTENETSLKVTPISPGHEILVSLTPLNLNAWNSFDIPLTSFPGVVMSDVFQFKFEGSGGKTVYIDNLYFHDNATVVKDTEAPTAFTAKQGTVTKNSVEVIMNATDNSGSVVYTISSVGHSETFTGKSGVDKSFVINNLPADTTLILSVIAKDSAGNAAANNPIVLTIKTLPNTPTGLAPIDFETVGQDWAWTLFENADNAPTLYSVVANPSTTGINTSAHAGKYVVNANGMPWAGLWSTNIGSFTFTADNCVVKLMVNKNVISNFDLKFENDNASVAFEKQVANTKTNEWELLTFDFSSQIGKTVSKIVIIPDFPTARTAGSVTYFDNITFGSGSAPVILTPTVAAPAPTALASDVISIFSDAYTNVANTNYAASWGQTTVVSNVNIATNPTLKYENLNYQGTELGSHVDASAMQYLHVDVWTPNETSLQITPISPGHEMLVALTPLVKNSWNSFDIPLTAFTGVVLSDVFQFKVVGGGGNIVYLDNLYFYKKPVAPKGPATVDFETVGQDWAWTLFENADNAPALYSVVANPSTTGINTSAHVAKYVVNANGMPWAGLWSSNIGEFTVSEDNCIMKLQVNKNVISNFDLKFENADASVNFEKLVPNTVINQWEELVFDFTAQIGKKVSKIVIIPDFPTARTAGSVNYFDNIQFLSKLSGVNAVQTERNVMVANSGRNQLTVKSGVEIKNIAITNMIGQSVKAMATNGSEINVDLNALSTGYYLVTVKLANGNVITKKIVKQ